MKNYILATLTSNKGRIASYVAGIIVSQLVRFVGYKFNVTIPENLVVEFNLAAPVIVAWIIDGIVIHINSQGTKAVQEVLQEAPTVTAPVVVDGVPGTGLLTAVKEAANGEVPPQV